MSSVANAKNRTNMFSPPPRVPVFALSEGCCSRCQNYRRRPRWIAPPVCPSGPDFRRWADDGRTACRPTLAHSCGPKTRPAMKNDQLLSQISEFCQDNDMAETTFGRRAVNDGKLVHRLREGKRITIDTLERIQAYIAAAGGVPLPRNLDVVPE